MIKDLKQRVLEKLAFRYWIKNPKRNTDTNWKLAEKFLNFIEKRKSLIERLLK